MKNEIIYDCAIIGAGVAGLFAANKIINENKNLKVIVFDIGAAFSKRRSQICGALGSLPFSDGKLWMNDVDSVEALIGKKKIKSAKNETVSLFKKVIDFKPVKNKKVNISADNKFKKNGYTLQYNEYVQMYPSNIHALSKVIASNLDKKATFSFNNEVQEITKDKNIFHLKSEDGDFKAKKVLISVGRAGWRWAGNVFKNFGIVSDNDYCCFGIKAEMSAANLKDFNKSTISLTKDDVSVGTFSWNGTVIPEDHVDMAISSFRSNEGRWNSDKVSFDIMAKKYFKNNGYEQADRIANLTFILTNERISKERISLLINKKSKISIMKEYDWLKDVILDLNNFIPDLATKGYFHSPTVITLPPKINLSNDLESDIEGLFVAGETAGVQGILAAALMGTAVAEGILK